MATRLHITESSDTLRAVVEHDMLRWERILTACTATACTGLASIYFLPGHWWLIASAVALVASFVAALRTKRVELRVTKLEFFTRGNLDVKFRLGQAVCTSDVRWLEFCGAGAGEAQNESEGLYESLYAVTARSSALLLPFITESEANQLITQIKEKFPAMAEHWRPASAFERNFLSLGIRGTK